MLHSNPVERMPDATALTLFLDYVSNPQAFWPENRPAMGERARSRLDRAARRAATDTTTVARDLVAMAEKRHGMKRRSILLANIGSSGSHWFEQLLVDGAGMLGAGEVYLPLPIQERVGQLPQDEQAVFIDALHLLYADAHGRDVGPVTVINSLHSARPDVYLNAMPDAMRILLVRHPVTVCVSRTFRKNEYREYVAPEADDVAYLDLNIKRIQSFYNTARQEFYDLTIRYEDLRRDALPALVATCALTDTPFDVDNLRRVIERHDADNVKAGREVRATNLFLGKQKRLRPSIEKRMQDRLGPLAAQLGYAQQI